MAPFRAFCYSMVVIGIALTVRSVAIGDAAMDLAGSLAWILVPEWWRNIGDIGGGDDV